MNAQDFALRFEPPASRSLSPALAATTRGGIVVFSGGSAANNLVDVFNDIREANNTALSYVIPISDNGGSSSEIIRVFGGPGTAPNISKGRNLATHSPSEQALAMFVLDSFV